MTEKARRRGSGSRTESHRTGPADPARGPGRGSGEMLAMVLTDDRETRLERRPVPTPHDDQVLVDIDLCGICGSDLDAAYLHEVYLDRGLQRELRTYLGYYNHHRAHTGRHTRGAIPADLVHGARKMEPR